MAGKIEGGESTQIQGTLSDPCLWKGVLEGVSKIATPGLLRPCCLIYFEIEMLV